MGLDVAITLKSPLDRYLQTQQQQHNQSAETLIARWLDEWYEARLHELYQQYRNGDLTLRAMGQQLGLDSYELYELMAHKNLTV